MIPAFVLTTFFFCTGAFGFAVVPLLFLVVAGGAIGTDITSAYSPTHLPTRLVIPEKKILKRTHVPNSQMDELKSAGTPGRDDPWTLSQVTDFSIEGFQPFDYYFDLLVLAFYVDRLLSLN
jgi:hypothetical protein